jgi:hypothetical protein
MTPPSLTIEFSYKPPASTTNETSLPLSGTHTFVVRESANTTNESSKDYYAGLRSAIIEAKKQMGDELTAWRDAVGKAEDGKEANVKVVKNEEASDEELEDDEA